MFSNQKSPTSCADCIYWTFKHSDCIEHGELGECRRFPPTCSEAIQIATHDDLEKRSLRYQSEEKRLSERQDVQDRKYSKLRSKMDTIEESIETSLSEKSIDYWISEKEKQQKKIDALLAEKYDHEGEYKVGETEFGTSAQRGIWMLTSSDDWCGEWKKR